MQAIIAARVSRIIMNMTAANRGPKPNTVSRSLRLLISMALLLLPVAPPLYVAVSTGGSTMSDDDESVVFHKFSSGGGQ